MRKIDKRSEPTVLGHWRAANQADPGGTGVNFGYDALRQSDATTLDLLESLIAEQGSVCAYTGRMIDSTSAHIEHLCPQAHCQKGQDVAYSNMVACWPPPNGPHGEYGAHPKRNWPSPGDAHLFVSPLSNGCERRFCFNTRGEIKPASASDNAATQTISKLRLDHKTLTALRASAIEGTLGKYRKLKADEARRRIRSIAEAEKALGSGADTRLDPYCFALKQALEIHVKAIERNIKFRKSS